MTTTKNNITEIEKSLKNLKLAWITKSLEIRNKEAIERKLSYTEFLELLIEDENANRENNSLKKRQSKSHVPHDKTLEDYDFNFQPQLNKKQVFDLATCNFIEKKENIILMWQPWTWKTHLASAIAKKALLAGYKVLFTTVSEMIDTLHKSKADWTYDNKIKYYLNPDLLVLDELWFKPLSQHTVNDFFEIISKRYENNSIIITSNKTFDEWESVFFDKVLATAIIDRLVHHCTPFFIKWESYRVRDHKNKELNNNNN